MSNEKKKKVDFIKVYIVLKKELGTNGAWRLHFKENKKKKFYEFDTQKEAVEYFRDNFSNAVARVHGTNGKWRYRITTKDNQISLKTYDSKKDSPDKINEEENITLVLGKGLTETKDKPKKEAVKKDNYKKDKPKKVSLFKMLIILSIAANLIVSILLASGAI